MGNIKQVTLPAGTVLTYSWDGYNRWVAKVAGGTFVAGNLYEDQYRISATFNVLGQIAREYVYATKVNVPDYIIMGGFKYRMITDHLGSPRLLVRTDNGVVTQRMDYNTLGLVTADTNPTIHPFGFAGGLWDPQTMTIRFGARTYDPRATGRWMSKDPIRFKGGDMNLYGYVLNDPINRFDFAGLESNLSDEMRENIENRIEDLKAYLKSLKDTCEKKYETVRERVRGQIDELMAKLREFEGRDGSD